MGKGKLQEAANIKNFSKWKNPISGVYRYVLATNFCYEIAIIKQVFPKDDVLNAKANAYASGEWRDDENDSIYEREELAHNCTVWDCLLACSKDYLENCD